MHNENSIYTGMGENFSAELIKELTSDEMNPITIFEENTDLKKESEENVRDKKINWSDYTSSNETTLGKINSQEIKNKKEKISEIKNNINNTIGIDNTINGECSGCAKCCQAILPVSKKEIQRIKSYIGVKKIRPINRHTMLDTEFINICPFLSFSKRCMIYPVRPEVCSRFLCSQYKSKSAKYFNHTDKLIVNFYNEFLSHLSYPCPETNILKLNATYTAQKRKLASAVYFKRKGK